MRTAIKHTVKVSLLAVSLAGAMLLSGCGPKQDDNHIKVGISAGIDQPLWDTVKKVAKDKYNLDVEVVTFTDYVLPNSALSSGDIDANSFQHGPYLEKQIAERGYKLAVVGNTFVYPIAGYSRKIKSVAELKRGLR